MEKGTVERNRKRQGRKEDKAKINQINKSQRKKFIDIYRKINCFENECNNYQC
jgi:hypothetical protein